MGNKNSDTTQTRFESGSQTEKTGLVNSKQAPIPDDQIVIIGRNTKYGNPFKMEKDGGEYTREGCVEAFTKWWYADEQAELRAQAKEELTGEVMGCYCLGEGNKYNHDDVIYTVKGTPSVCHGEVILQFINQATASNPD